MPHVNARLEAVSDGVFAVATVLLIKDVQLPSAADVASAGLWQALNAVAPTAYAFLLSFNVIAITWVNHRAIMRLVAGTSPALILANGFLLLTIVVIPFPTQLLGQYLRTDEAAPAIVIYIAALAAIWLGWIVVTHTMIRGRLAKDTRAAAALTRVVANSRAAFVLYSVLSVSASWFPITALLLTTLTWAFWLMASIRLRRT